VIITRNRRSDRPHRRRPRAGRRRTVVLVTAAALALSTSSLAVARTGPWHTTARTTLAAAAQVTSSSSTRRHRYPRTRPPTSTIANPTTTTNPTTTKPTTTTNPTTTTTKPTLTTPTTVKPTTVPTTTVPTTTVPTTSSVTPPAGGRAPAQPGAVVYGGTTGVGAYAHRGALVIAGRDNYAAQPFKDVAAAGGTVLIYLDPMIDNPYGRYHTLLNQASTCGPATSRWPGNPGANDSGNLNDFRPNSVLQQKLDCVLETMVRENPHLGGFFADDVGSMSWFPKIDWSSWSATDKALYRQGAIDLTKTFRTVADRHGLVVVVNGTWDAGSQGGGYPDVNRPGNALADGGSIEHHDTVDQFFKTYACSTQWAAQSSVTSGRAINFAVNNTAEGTSAWIGTGCVAYASTQSSYASIPAPWGPFYDRGLPDGL